ncbi:unnamed protein product [Nesidiocoris tenuis]|uniref:Uncharacterized protein n=1 Tax=Nesidiocoris tenuis TaxID=355587 RepID=A0A6H5H6F0_9HEMI|nr:unnamed protein product [Nesidiocoris tenuis]
MGYRDMEGRGQKSGEGPVRRSSRIQSQAREAKTMVQLPTGVVFDEKMLEHECLWDRAYPECPERLSAVIDRSAD